MFSKSMTTFLLASLAAHTLFAAAIYYPTFMQELEYRNLVQIEYIERLPAKVVSEKKVVAAPVVEKITKSVVKAAAPQALRTIDLPKERSPISNSKASPQKIAVKPERVPIRQTVSSVKPAPAIQTSQDILADPAKGKYFATYFAKIKEKIQKGVQRKYSSQNIGGGSVTLLFVLDSDGGLDRVSVLEKQSTADSAVKSFAMQSVRDAAPFDHFPPEINLAQISFNLTVLFEEV